MREDPLPRSADALEDMQSPNAVIQVALPDDVISSINALCTRHNLVRDSLFNRILFLLTSAPKTFVLVFGLPEDVLNVIAEESIQVKKGQHISFGFDWPRPSSLKEFSPPYQHHFEVPLQSEDASLF